MCFTCDDCPPLGEQKSEKGLITLPQAPILVLGEGIDNQLIAQLGGRIEQLVGYLDQSRFAKGVGLFVKILPGNLDGLYLDVGPDDALHKCRALTLADDKVRGHIMQHVVVLSEA